MLAPASTVASAGARYRATILGLCCTIAAGACDSAQPVMLQPQVTQRFEYQVAPPNGEIDVPPSIVIADRSGKGIPGVTVNFVALHGVVTGGTVVTDTNGFAEAGSWRLGPTEGLQTVHAVLGDGTVFPMTARAVPCPSDPMNEAIPFPYGTYLFPTGGAQSATQRRGTLSSTDCTNPVGERFDRFEVGTSDNVALFSLSLAKSSFGYMSLRLGKDYWVYGDVSNPIYAIVQSGGYRLNVFGDPAGYLVSSSNGPANAERGSCHFYTVKGIVVGQTLDNACTSMDYYVVVAGAMASVAARVTASFDVRVDAYDCATGGFLASSTGATGNHSVSVTFPPSSGTRCVDLFVYTPGTATGTFALQVF